MSASAPPPAPQQLAEVLELERLDSNLFRSRVNQINVNRSLFGGQILGQGLQAAAQTVDPQRQPHSLHGYFLLAGASDIPVIYDVELTRDGGSFSTRRVVARQRARPIFHMELSFHRREPGFEHSSELEGEVPDPEQLLSTVELGKKYAALLPPGLAQMLGLQTIVDMRPLEPDTYLFRRPQSARARFWIKSAARLPDDPLTQLSALAYLSDYFLASTAALIHTVPAAGNVMMASLDHAMWFHRALRADEWILVDAVSPFAGGARGLTRAGMFDRERRLLASVMQEGLVRPIVKT